MEDKKFTLKEIIKVIHQCPIIEVDIETPKDGEIEIQHIKTVEVAMFLYKLYDSNPEEFEKYINKFKPEE